jgi:hypothetical protein
MAINRCHSQKETPPAAEAATKVHQLSTRCRRGLPATSGASDINQVASKVQDTGDGCNAGAQ